MEIISDGPVPPYRQIAARLREAIEAGEYVPDVTPLPSRKRLAQETGCAVTTIDRAYAVLRDEGLVYAVAARGWFVKGPE